MTEMPLHDGFAVAPRRRLDIREIALNARRVLGLPDGRIDIPRLLDRLTEFGINYDVLEPCAMPNGVEACYYPEDRTMYIRTSVYAQMVSGGSRATFTFGHELGHAVLGHQRGFNRQAREVPVYSQSEWQANTFAAEFSMPIEQIRRRGLLTSQAIAQFFGVSPAAANIRLEDLSRRGELR